MGDENLDAAITRLSKDLLKLAREIQYEQWTDQDAQDWYVAGIKDSAHLTMLKWIDNDNEKSATGITELEDASETQVSDPQEGHGT
jgi:hypothetical protein